jgi:hypothetical protein
VDLTKYIVKNFSTLSNFRKRAFLKKIFKRIEVYPHYLKVFYECGKSEVIEGFDYPSDKEYFFKTTHPLNPRFFSSKSSSVGADGGDDSPISEPLQPMELIKFSTKPLIKSKFFLGREYLNKGKSLNELSKKLKIPRSTILDQMVKFGIPRRVRGRSYKNPQNIPFGYRLKHGSIIQHKGEQKTIEIIRKRRIVYGECYSKIATHLNEKFIPTRFKRSKWHHTMIKRIIERERIRG